MPPAAACPRSHRRPASHTILPPRAPSALVPPNLKISSEPQEPRPAWKIFGSAYASAVTLRRTYDPAAGYSSPTARPCAAEHRQQTPHKALRVACYETRGRVPGFSVLLIFLHSSSCSLPPPNVLHFPSLCSYVLRSTSNPLPSSLYPPFILPSSCRFPARLRPPSLV
ncbi:hypothetical protein C8R44DRAFT_987111 [Mycena epipterygia]|nr:hypothetical protein C8R44DRAFT_987111 [Mycena epipterygia]